MFVPWKWKISVEGVYVSPKINNTQAKLYTNLLIVVITVTVQDEL